MISAIDVNLQKDQTLAVDVPEGARSVRLFFNQACACVECLRKRLPELGGLIVEDTMESRSVLADALFEMGLDDMARHARAALSWTHRGRQNVTACFLVKRAPDSLGSTFKGAINTVSHIMQVFVAEETLSIPDDAYILYLTNAEPLVDARVLFLREVWNPNLTVEINKLARMP